MAIQLDNIHYEWREIDGYNKPFNVVMSPREPGKTSMMWFKKIYQPFLKDHRPWVYWVRKSVEITEALITSIFDTIIYKFSDDRFPYTYNKGSFKDGIVDVYLIINDIKYLFFRIVSLSIDLRRIKLAVVKNIKSTFMDEYIIDPRSGEKYQDKEAFKLKEAYTTWRRECDGMLRFYFACNPYSLFCPLFLDWGVDTLKLRRGEFYVGDIYVIHWATLNPLLREKLLKENPLYKFDEEYNQYALEGIAINDSNIRLGTLPQNYSLNFVLRYQSKYIGVFKNNYYNDEDDRFFCKFLDQVGAKRTSYCFDFEDMVKGTMLLSLDDRGKLGWFKSAMRRNLVSFEDVNVYYLVVEVYKNI